MTKDDIWIIFLKKIPRNGVRGDKAIRYSLDPRLREDERGTRG